MTVQLLLIASPSVPSGFSWICCKPVLPSVWFTCHFCQGSPASSSRSVLTSLILARDLFQSVELLPFSLPISALHKKIKVSGTVKQIVVFGGNISFTITVSPLSLSGSPFPHIGGGRPPVTILVAFAVFTSAWFSSFRDRFWPPGPFPILSSFSAHDHVILERFSQLPVGFLPQLKCRQQLLTQRGRSHICAAASTQRATTLRALLLQCPQSKCCPQVRMGHADSRTAQDFQLTPLSLGWLGGGWWGWPTFEATSWRDYLEPDGDGVLPSEENQKHCMVTCTCYFSVWFILFLVQIVPLCKAWTFLVCQNHFPPHVWSAGTEHSIQSYNGVDSCREKTKRVVYLLLVLTLTWFWFHHGLTVACTGTAKKCVGQWGGEVETFLYVCCWTKYMGLCPLYFGRENPARNAQCCEVASSFPVWRQEPSFFCFSLGIKSLLDNSSLPAKTQRKLWGGMGNICLSYDVNIDKNRKRTGNGFYSASCVEVVFFNRTTRGLVKLKWECLQLFLATQGEAVLCSYSAADIYNLLWSCC